MQVSWIDPDEIARLAAQLDGPLQRDESAPWDPDTLLDFSELVTLEEPRAADSADLADAIEAPVPESLDRRGAAPPPEIEHIRENLRAIRSRAQNAGLLPPQRLSNIRQEAIPAAEQTKVSIPPAVGIELAPVSVRIPPLAILPVPEPAKEAPVSHLPSPAPFLPLDGTLTERLKGFMPWARSIAPSEDILLVDDHGDLLWGSSTRADLALSVVLAAGAGLRAGSDALTHSSVFIRSRLGEQGELSVLPCPTRHGMVTLALLNPASLTNETAACLREALTLCIEGKNPEPDPAAASRGDTTS